MQNRSIFPYRRHGPKKRVKHGPNRKARGPQKGLPNSARDLLPMLQPATKALAQVLAGRAGASGQLGHARAMLAQAERLIAERAHNRLSPAEREEFFEQLARLKLTLADADAEAEVQAVEEQEPRPAAPPPVAQERLKEMALALSGRERPGEPKPQAAPDAPGETAPEDEAPHAAAPTDASPEAESDQADDAKPQEATSGVAATGRGDRLMLPKVTAEQAAQAVAFGGMARRRTRAPSRAATAAAVAVAQDESAARAARAERKAQQTPEPGADAAKEAAARIRVPQEAERQELPLEEKPDKPDHEAHEGNGASVEAEPRTRSTSRRPRKSKHQGLPEGWVIDEEGFVVPGAD